MLGTKEIQSDVQIYDALVASIDQEVEGVLLCYLQENSWMSTLTWFSLQRSGEESQIEEVSF